MVPSTAVVPILTALVLAGGCTGGSEERPPYGRDVLLHDEFDGASMGWLGRGETRFEGENVDIEIAGGRMVMTVTTPEGRGGIDSTDLAVRNADELESLTDVEVEVSATVTTLVEDAFYATLCRMQDFDNFYGFALVEGGSASIFKLEDKVAEELAVVAGVVPDDGAEHRISARCSGDSLRMSVDGAPVLTAEDDTFASGAVGLLVETRGEAGLVVEFDDFSVVRAGG